MLESRAALGNMSTYERQARAKIAEATIRNTEGGDELLKLMEDDDIFGEIKLLEASLAEEAEVVN